MSATSTFADDATITDLFCGAGGSSLGAAAAGGRIVMAANHWDVAIRVHNTHFPDADHDCADISRADPRRYRRTRILIASPECTNHSQARGVSRKLQDPTLWDEPDPSAVKSRATMWDVIRFTEQMHYDAVIVENVVEAAHWVLWPTWYAGMEALGYKATIVSRNSMHNGVPQSRDRIYVVWLRRGLKADLEMELLAWCSRCTAVRTVRQAWKAGRHVGRYRQQYVWSCTSCSTICEPVTEPAASIIDWDLPCPRIGSRRKVLAEATRSRIFAGMVRHGWTPITTSGAGNTHERTPGNRARSTMDPLPVQQATATSAVTTPPGFLAGTNRTTHGHRLHALDDPHPTVCASDDRLSLVVNLRGTNAKQLATSAHSTADPLGVVSAGGIHSALVVSNNHGNTPQPPTTPLATVTTGNRHALLMRNNGGLGEMVTPVDEPARTMVSKLNQSLLIPYNGNGQAKPVTEPLGTQPATDRWSLLEREQLIDDCGFRMLEPYEIAAAMAFPVGYIPRDLAKKDQVKLAGNAVTPPVMTWIIGRVLQALEAAA